MGFFGTDLGPELPEEKPMMWVIKGDQAAYIKSLEDEIKRLKAELYKKHRCPQCDVELIQPTLGTGSAGE